MSKPTTAVGQEILRFLRKPNFHYQHWTFSETNVGKMPATFMYLDYFLSVPSTSALPYQTAAF